jgi:hypothetical protein
MLLIIAHHHDQEAVWLYKNLLESGEIPVRLLVPETLGLDYHISLNLFNTLAAKSSVNWFATGETIFNTDVHWLINRLNYIDPIIWNRSASAEKQYATSELNAFFAAFIHSFSCKISNPIQNGCLYGQIQFLPFWISYFQKKGIQPHSLLLKNNFSRKKAMANPEKLLRFLCHKNSIYQPAEQTSAAELTKLLSANNLLKPWDLMEFVFMQTRSPQKFHFISASPTPCFSAYGKAFTQTVINHYKTTCHDTAIWNTKRKSDGTFNPCLHATEPAALCF